MSLRNKSVVLLAVIAAHASVLFGIYPASAVEFQTSEIRIARIFQATLLAGESVAITEQGHIAAAPFSFSVRPGTLRPMQSKPAERNPVSKPIKTGVNEIPRPTEKLPSLTLDGFWEVSEVDSPASPIDDFGDALQQRLPPILVPVVIEFWISQDGATVQAACFERNCPASVTDRLGDLLDLRFQPAIKSGLAVSSRKLVQIEPQASL